MNSAFLRLHKLSTPIFISYLVGVVFAFADDAIIGRYNIESYAAVIVIGSVVYYIIGAIGTFSVSLSLNGASLLKEKDYKTYEKLFNTTLYIGLLLSFVFIAITYLFAKEIVNYFFSTNEQVLAIAIDYLQVISLSFPLNVLIFTFSSYFKTAEKPGALVYASTFSALTNVAVNYLLVFGVCGFPRLGATGIAIGTIAGLSVSLSLYLFYFKKQNKIKVRYLFCREQAKIVLQSFSILFTQELFEYSLFYFLLLGVISQSGVANTSIYGILSTIFSILIMYAYSYGNALIILARKESSNPVYLMRMLKISLMSFLCLYLVYTFFLSFLGEQVPALITNDVDIYSSTANFIVIFSVSQLFIGIATILRYYLNGASLEKFVLKTCCVVCSLSGFLIYFVDHFYSLPFTTVLAMFTATYVLLSIIFYYKVLEINRIPVALYRDNI